MTTLTTVYIIGIMFIILVEVKSLGIILRKSLLCISFASASWSVNEEPVREQD